MAEGSIDFNNAESWSLARRYAGLLGPVPSSVSGAIRTLWSNHDEYLKTGESQDSSGRVYSAVRRVDRSAVLKTPIYFAALALFSEKFAETTEDDTSKALVQICGSGMFAALLGMIYLHKRFGKVCKADEWPALSAEMILNMEYGYLLGKEVSGLDPAIGMLAGGIRYAAFATYLMRDKQSYLKYRENNTPFDLRAEHKKWGCDHGQIAGFILKALGFSGDQMLAAYALRGYIDGELNSILQTLRSTVELLDAVIAQKSLNDINFLASEFKIADDQYGKLLGMFAALSSDGGSFDWMNRSVKEEEEEPSE